MFYQCQSLISLNLSTLDTSSATSIYSMFSGSSQLEYINIKKADLPEGAYKDNMFNSVSTNLIICSEKEGWSIFFTNRINVYCHNMDYGFKCYTNNTQILYNKYFCENCNNNK